MTSRKKWGIALILLPVVSFIVLIFLQIVVKFALTSNLATVSQSGASCQSFETKQDGSSDMYAIECGSKVVETNSLPITKLIGIVSILLGTISVLGFLPCLITGIILLTAPGKQPLPPPTE